MSRCDFIIDGARLIDGSGGPSRYTSVAIDRERIVDVGHCQQWQADHKIEANGKTLAPGFIDSHTHDDLAVFNTPDLPCKISQGVTTVIAGNCGISLAPLSTETALPAPFPLLGKDADFRFPSIQAYREQWLRTPAAVNIAMLTGHSSLRMGHMSDSLESEADTNAIEAMQDSLRCALQQGSIGLSTGLDYPPAAASTTHEIIQVAKVLREFENSRYVTHMRDEGAEILEAIDETLEIGQASRVPVIISHHKCAGPSNYGRSGESLKKIDSASKTQAVSFDVYPYTASSTSLLYQYVIDSESVIVAESVPHPEYNNMLLDRIASDWNCTLEEACDRLYPASAIYFQMSNIDLEQILKHPAAMIGSDGIASMKMPHPRLWGTFPRVLGHYVREKKLFDLETAVHKMTGLTANRFALHQRGEIKIGNYADLVLFDAESIIDTASFDNPEQICEGIDSVWVNGELSWHQSSSTTARNGQFLSRA
ncbi:MAG: D-aminoacylase [Pseudomonadota bacterium]